MDEWVGLKAVEIKVLLTAIKKLNKFNTKETLRAKELNLFRLKNKPKLCRKHQN